MVQLLRTTVVTLVLGAATLGGLWTWSADRHRREMDRLEATNARLDAQIEERRRMIERLSRSRRVAHLQVLGQDENDHGVVTSTKVRFIELDDQGAELARQDFTVPGQVIMVDAWTVKFDSERVAEGHPLTGRSLVLLRRIYSDQMRPVDGFEIDTPGAVPPAYVVTPESRFQQQIWEHFWTLATDAGAARAMGVRVAQGEAVYKPVRPGQTFELIVDAVGGMSLMPMEEQLTQG